MGPCIFARPRSSRAWARAFLALGFGFAGCADEPAPAPLRTELFVESCTELLGCPCDVPAFTDVDECARVHAVRYAVVVGTAAVLGLAVDEECVLRQLPVSIHHCATAPEVYLVPEPPCTFCAPIHGVIELGEACIEYHEFSDCAPGLRCVEQRCVDPCNPGDVAIPCSPERGCPPRFYCEPNSERCLPTPQEGDPCPPECARGLICRTWLDPPACGPRSHEGEACGASDHCEDALVCLDGVCSVPLPPGSPCVSEVCGVDADCDLSEHVCKMHNAVGEPCDIGGPSCVTSAYCNYESGACEAERQAGESCDEWYQQCVDGLRCHGEPPVCGPLEAYLCDL